jgi:hypothetical protein
MTTNTFFPDNKFFPPVPASVIVPGQAISPLHTKVTGKKQLSHPWTGGEGLAETRPGEAGRALIINAGERGQGLPDAQRPERQLLPLYFVDFFLIFAEKVTMDCFIIN